MKKFRIKKVGGVWRVPPFSQDFNRDRWLCYLSAMNLCIKLNNREDR